MPVWPSSIENVPASIPLEGVCLQRFRELLSEPIDDTDTTKEQLIRELYSLCPLGAGLYINGGSAQSVGFGREKNDLDLVVFVPDTWNFSKFSTEYSKKLRSYGVKDDEIRILKNHRIISFKDIDIKFPSQESRTHLFDEDALAISLDRTISPSITLIPRSLIGRGMEQLSQVIHANNRKELHLSRSEDAQKYAHRLILKLTQGWECEPQIVDESMIKFGFEEADLSSYNLSLHWFILGHTKQMDVRRIFLLNLDSFLKGHPIAARHRAVLEKHFREKVTDIPIEQEKTNVLFECLEQGFHFDPIKNFFSFYDIRFFLENEFNVNLIAAANYDQERCLKALITWVERSRGLEQNIRLQYIKNLIKSSDHDCAPGFFAELQAFIEEREKVDSFQVFKQLTMEAQIEYLLSKKGVNEWEKPWLLSQLIQQDSEEIAQIPLGKILDIYKVFSLNGKDHDMNLLLTQCIFKLPIKGVTQEEFQAVLDIFCSHFDSTSLKFADESIGHWILWVHENLLGENPNLREIHSCWQGGPKEIQGLIQEWLTLQVFPSPEKCLQFFSEGNQRAFDDSRYFSFLKSNFPIGIQEEHIQYALLNKTDIIPHLQKNPKYLKFLKGIYPKSKGDLRHILQDRLSLIAAMDERQDPEILVKAFTKGLVKGDLLLKVTNRSALWEAIFRGYLAAEEKARFYPLFMKAKDCTIELTQLTLEQFKDLHELLPKVKQNQEIYRKIKEYIISLCPTNHLLPSIPNKEMIEGATEGDKRCFEIMLSRIEEKVVKSSEISELIRAIQHYPEAISTLISRCSEFELEPTQMKELFFLSIDHSLSINPLFLENQDFLSCTTAKEFQKYENAIYSLESRLKDPSGLYLNILTLALKEEEIDGRFIEEMSDKLYDLNPTEDDKQTIRDWLLQTEFWPNCLAPLAFAIATDLKDTRLALYSLRSLQGSSEFHRMFEDNIWVLNQILEKAAELNHQDPDVQLAARLLNYYWKSGYTISHPLKIQLSSYANLFPLESIEMNFFGLIAHLNFICENYLENKKFLEADDRSLKSIPDTLNILLNNFFLKGQENPRLEMILPLFESCDRIFEIIMPLVRQGNSKASLFLARLVPSLYTFKMLTIQGRGCLKGNKNREFEESLELALFQLAFCLSEGFESLESDPTCILHFLESKEVAKIPLSDERKRLLFLKMMLHGARRIVHDPEGVKSETAHVIAAFTFFELGFETMMRFGETNRISINALHILLEALSLEKSIHCHEYAFFARLTAAIIESKAENRSLCEIDPFAERLKSMTPNVLALKGEGVDFSAAKEAWKQAIFKLNPLFDEYQKEKKQLLSIISKSPKKKEAHKEKGQQFHELAIKAMKYTCLPSEELQWITQIRKGLQ
ncbi:MAG: hypothetical protein ACOYK9_05045 [Chlamydiia bacterium]